MKKRFWLFYTFWELPYVVGQQCGCVVACVVVEAMESEEEVLVLVLVLVKQCVQENETPTE